MDNESQSVEKTDAQQQAKKPYVKPELRSHGNLRLLSQMY